MAFCGQPLSPRGRRSSDCIRPGRHIRASRATQWSSRMCDRGGSDPKRGVGIRCRTQGWKHNEILEVGGGRADIEQQDGPRGVRVGPDCKVRGSPREGHNRSNGPGSRCSRPAIMGRERGFLRKKAGQTPGEVSIFSPSSRSRCATNPPRGAARRSDMRAWDRFTPFRVQSTRRPRFGRGGEVTGWVGASRGSKFSGVRYASRDRAL